MKIADLSISYDFVSARAGIQSFNSDFRGFIFSDQEPGLRIFGTLDSNRYQFNLAGFAMLEKDTNSGLNRMQVSQSGGVRRESLPAGFSLARIHDPGAAYITIRTTLRSSLIATIFSCGPRWWDCVQPHKIRAVYYGLTGDGHIGRLNLTHAFYQVLGNDSLNPIAGSPVRINARMAAAEVSLDHDWLRYRLSFFYASGDKNPLGRTASGFDGIFDNPEFAGGIFSFWNREGTAAHRQRRIA